MKHFKCRYWNTGKASAQRDTNVCLLMPKKISQDTLIKKNENNVNVKESTEDIVDTSTTHVDATGEIPVNTFTQAVKKKK